MLLTGLVMLRSFIRLVPGLTDRDVCLWDRPDLRCRTPLAAGGRRASGPPARGAVRSECMVQRAD